jgi:hypothetical protein
MSQAVFSVAHSEDIWLDWPSSVQLMSATEMSWVKWSELVGKLVSYSENCSCHCELLLLRAGRWGTGILRESRVRGTSAVGSRYRATAGEDRRMKRLFARALLNCRVCESVIVLQLLVVTSCVYKCSINPITNQYPVYSHTLTCDNSIILWPVVSL